MIEISRTEGPRAIAGLLKQMRTKLPVRDKQMLKQFSLNVSWIARCNVNRRIELANWVRRPTF
jgi:hypothetical protein